MANALRQSNTGGSGSGTTSAKGFTTENTLNSSLLLCVVRANVSNTSSAPVLTFDTPVTSGFTWTLVKSKVYSFLVSAGPPQVWEAIGVAVFMVANAGIMSTSVTTTTTVASSSGTPAVNFNLYEFTGVATSSPLDTTGSENGDDTVPNAGALTTSATDLIFVATTNPVSSVGSGYTEGLAADEQYILNEPSGSVSTDFGAVYGSPWAAVAGAFKAAVAASVANGYGFIIG